MEDYNRFVESTVRTNKLYCSDCMRKIKKGEDVIFELDENNRMVSVYCSDCSPNYERYIEPDDPGDSEYYDSKDY